MTELSPREIVSELDRFIIGQNDAKKAVSIALRNRWRRQQVSQPLRDEIVPKNILMVGPTGCGKTEIARRLAKLAKAPFIKIEATKFTEVGYVGRDVESIIRDLLEIAISQVKSRKREEVLVAAEASAKEKIIDALVGNNAGEETRRKFKNMLNNNELEDTEIEIQVLDNTNPLMSNFDIPGMPGGQMGIMSISDVLGKSFGSPKTKTRKMIVKDAMRILTEEECDKLVDMEAIINEARNQTENNGIVFLDEIDKISSRSESSGSGEVSREGVQRDLLPLLEGTTVNTKHGTVNTDHILFISSGAFHIAKPSDLLPELQGRLPIRVELSALTTEDMMRIIDEPEASMTKQYKALMATEGVDLSFTPDGIKAIAELAIKLNMEVENIGARRLHTVMEKLLEDLSFTASDKPGLQVSVDASYVDEHIGTLAKKTDLSKFIL